MRRTSKFRFGLVSISVALLGCSGADDPSEVGAGYQDQEFSTTPGEPNHEEITASALSFLKPEIVIALQAANVATDVQFFLVNANHFDDCNFTGGSQVVRASEAEAVAALAPDQAPVEGDVLAIRAFGRALHALQDFYAHTNWIELGGETLVDRSLGAFPVLGAYSTIPSTGFVVVQGPKPPSAALSRDEAASYPKSAVVSVKLGGPRHAKARSAGLISGTVDYEPGNFCPASVAMTHEELNKDKSSLVERSQQYEAAKTLAILQTEHEWCRLRALASAAWGPAGAARLDAWVAAGAIAPTCAAEP
ncbi:MAG: hypothetical protein K0R38_5956 [Polyangiaceae bacterium]|jgi:hypothetical protein|nr:hypothetical protein [Polyangiaceae bacterium]